MNTSIHTKLANSMVTQGEPGGDQVSRDCKYTEGYIPQCKVPLASSSESLYFIVCEVSEDGLQCTVVVYYLHPVTYTVRPSVDAGEMIRPA